MSLEAHPHTSPRSARTSAGVDGAPGAGAPSAPAERSSGRSHPLPRRVAAPGQRGATRKTRPAEGGIRRVRGDPRRRAGAPGWATRTEPLALQGPDQLPAAAEGATRPQCTCTCRAPAPPRGPPTWLGSCHHVWRDTPRARFLLRDHTRAAHVPTLPPPRWARRPPRVAPRARLSRVHAAARSPHVAWLMPSRAARRTARALSVRYVT